MAISPSLFIKPTSELDEQIDRFQRLTLKRGLVESKRLQEVTPIEDSFHSSTHIVHARLKKVFLHGDEKNSAIKISLVDKAGQESPWFIPKSTQEDNYNKTTIAYNVTHDLLEHLLLVGRFREENIQDSPGEFDAGMVIAPSQLIPVTPKQWDALVHNNALHSLGEKSAFSSLKKLITEFLEDRFACGSSMDLVFKRPAPDILVKASADPPKIVRAFDPQLPNNYVPDEHLQSIYSRLKDSCITDCYWDQTKTSPFAQNYEQIVIPRLKQSLPGSQTENYLTQHYRFYFKENETKP